MKHNLLLLPLVSVSILTPIGTLAASTGNDGYTTNHQGAHENIEEVVISASPHGKSSGDIAGSFNVLSGETLNREVAATLGESLKGQIGISSSSFGPGVGLPVIRGLSGSRVAVLQNSSPVADASQTSPDHAIALEPMLADRIEILRGPASLRYGPGAIGGVVNIIDNRIHTEPQQHFDAVVETRYGTNNDSKTVVGRLDGGRGALNIHLSGLNRDSNAMEIPGFASTETAADETTNGYVANTDAETRAWNLGFSHVTDKLIVGVGISRIDSDYGIPPGGHSHHDEHDDDEHEYHHDHDLDHQDEDHSDLFTRIDMHQTEYSGKFLLRDLPGVFDKLDLNLTHSEYQHEELEIVDAAIEVGSRYATRENQLRTELTFQTGDWLGAAGIQAKDKTFSATGEETFVPPNEVEIAGIFITEETTLGNGTLEMGLRLDRQTVDTSDHQKTTHNLTNASASYLYQITDTQQLSLIYTHSQRAPTAEELYSQGEHAATNTYVVGNPAMNREAANSLEVTWSWDGPVQLNASVYHRDFADFIFESTDTSRFSHDLADQGNSDAAVCTSDIADFDGDLEEFEEALPCYFYQQQDARFTGAELELTTLINDDTSIRLWGDTVRATLDGGGNVPRMPPARLGANLDFSTGNWIAGIGVTHGFAQRDVEANETATNEYSRFDGHVSYNAENWSVFLKGSNLSDEEIRNSTSFLKDIAPEPGRAIELGVRFNFH